MSGFGIRIFLIDFITLKIDMQTISIVINKERSILLRNCFIISELHIINLIKLIHIIQKKVLTHISNFNQLGQMSSLLNINLNISLVFREILIILIKGYFFNKIKTRIY